MVIGAIKKIKLSELTENIWKNSVPDGKNIMYKDFKIYSTIEKNTSRNTFCTCFSLLGLPLQNPTDWGA